MAECIDCKPSLQLSGVRCAPRHPPLALPVATKSQALFEFFKDENNDDATENTLEPSMTKLQEFWRYEQDRKKMKAIH
ncbi:hypothetical protein ACROYT_G022673 [Oculina patagonica]